MSTADPRRYGEAGADVDDTWSGALAGTGLAVAVRTALAGGGTAP